MKNKLSLDELRVQSFITSDENQIKETVKGGVGIVVSIAVYHTKKPFCGETGFQGCGETDVAICGHPTEGEGCDPRTGHAGCY